MHEQHAPAILCLDFIGLVLIWMLLQEELPKKDSDLPCLREIATSVASRVPKQFRNRRLPNSFAKTRAAPSFAHRNGKTLRCVANPKLLKASNVLNPNVLVTLVL